MFDCDICLDRNECKYKVPYEHHASNMKLYGYPFDIKCKNKKMVETPKKNYLIRCYAIFIITGIYHENSRRGNPPEKRCKLIYKKYDMYDLTDYSLALTNVRQKDINIFFNTNGIVALNSCKRHSIIMLHYEITEVGAKPENKMFDKKKWNY